jgi:hypothetical protein
VAKSSKRSTRGSSFPIVETYGFPYDSNSPAAQHTWHEELCPFSEGLCEKKRQYGFGYCSVTYAATWDNHEQQTYAVCDHRLDGDPVSWAVKDHFGEKPATLVPEVTATTKPKLNIDYVAFANDNNAQNGADLIAIETQAIDLRGGGVGPAWEAWEANDVANWRGYFTREAARKGRRDTVDYGVNTGNVYKRLGTQVAVKSEYLTQIDVPLYVIMQHSILQQLRARVNFVPVEVDQPWDITFAGFDYNGSVDQNGQLQLHFIESVRTTAIAYISAMTTSGDSKALRKDFIDRVRKKIKTEPSQASLFSAD